ncbi:MAG: hypothetical protein M3069_32415 [Chloroflexota bacterium]|nr:hypothetical protein [Chloroflexota bacterium]
MHNRVLNTVLIVALVALAASAIHAPHWPGMLFGMHEPTGMAANSMVPGPTGAAFHTAEASAKEVWCSVEAVAPALFQVPLTLLATGLVLAITVLAPTIGLIPSRTKPPPLVGSRLRATLQVFRN